VIDVVRWGILGAAKIAREQVIPGIQLSRNGKVHAIAAREAMRARAVAEPFGIPLCLDSYEAVLACKEVDAVYIPLITAQHVEWTKRAIASGKHVLCEKPIAMRAEEIDALIKLRDASQLVVGEAFMVAHHPQWHLVRDLVQGGKIGQLRVVQGVFTYALFDPDNMRNRPEMGGGGLRDIGVYPVVTTRIVTGKEPHAARADIEYDPKFGTDRFANCHLSFDGFELDFYCATQLAGRQEMTFHGTEGWVTIEVPFNARLLGMTKVVMRRNTQKGVEEFYFASENQYQLQAENFADAIAGKSALAFPLESSRANQRAIDMIFQAGQANRR
jgi:predicted dehydrogenase